MLLLSFDKQRTVTFYDVFIWFHFCQVLSNAGCLEAKAVANWLYHLVHVAISCSHFIRMIYWVIYEFFVTTVLSFICSLFLKYCTSIPHFLVSFEIGQLDLKKLMETLQEKKKRGGGEGGLKWLDSHWVLHAETSQQSLHKQAVLPYAHPALWPNWNAKASLSFTEKVTLKELMPHTFTFFARLD